VTQDLRAIALPTRGTRDRVEREGSVGPITHVALSYDHHIVDGLEAVQFLASVRKFIEDPAQLLIEG
jgi:2-oxoglutarate dehydrogenase E2 component (dihydrolipoamide succinyltransferase)